MHLTKLLVAITFHFNEERLGYLEAVASELGSFAENIQVVIITNESNPACHEKIRNRLPTLSSLEIFVPKLLGHPYLLTWSHMEVFRSYFKSCDDISHFLYLEDDILIRKENIKYWLKGREALNAHQIIPSFLRCEVGERSSIKVATDITASVSFFWVPKIKISSGYYYANLPQPYQGMYLLDRPLAEKHLFGLSSSPDFGYWAIREKAAQGITFWEVPKGCFSKNFVGVEAIKNSIDPGALIHHLPNNYANNPETKFGKIPIDKIFTFSLFFKMLEKKTQCQKLLKAPFFYILYQRSLRALLWRLAQKVKL
jgi:hypothetical protein